MIKKHLFTASAALLVFLSLGVQAEDAQPVAPAGQETPEGSIEVMRMVLARGIQDREPTDEITSAKVGDVVVGWTQIRSGVGETTITHRWLHEGENLGDIPLTIRSSPWRTWTRKTLGAPGNWTWQVLSPQGSVLKELTFTVAPADAAAPAPATTNP